MDWECRDIILYDDDGVAVYSGPRFLRCSRHAECGQLVTHGLLQQAGQCSCGNRKFNPALKVSLAERVSIIDGVIPVLDWERSMIEGAMQEIKLGGNESV